MHFRQEAELVDPGAGLYVPLGQSRQLAAALAPTVMLYFPVSQDVHSL
jgi:hypothetical protein